MKNGRERRSNFSTRFIAPAVYSRSRRFQQYKAVGPLEFIPTPGPGLAKKPPSQGPARHSECLAAGSYFALQIIALSYREIEIESREYSRRAKSCDHPSGTICPSAGNPSGGQLFGSLQSTP